MQQADFLYKQKKGGNLVCISAFINSEQKGRKYRLSFLMILLFNISFLSELNCSNLTSLFMCYENGKLVELTIGQFSISKTSNLNLVFSSISILSQYSLLFLKIRFFHIKVLCALNFGHISRTLLKLSKQSYLKYFWGSNNY